MSKNIVIFSDGTGQEGGKGNNVRRQMNLYQELYLARDTFGL